MCCQGPSRKMHQKCITDTLQCIIYNVFMRCVVKVLPEKNDSKKNEQKMFQMCAITNNMRDTNT